MPKNKGKGGKNRRRGKNEADDDKRELVFKTDNQGTSPSAAPSLRAVPAAPARPRGRARTRAPSALMIACFPT
jgi:hypothetical protein